MTTATIIAIDAIRARLERAKSVIAYYEKRNLQIMIQQEKRQYVADVAALLAALDAKAQKEATRG